MLLLGMFFVVISNVFGIFPAQIIRHAFNLIRENIFLYHLYDQTALQPGVFQLFGLGLLLFGGVVILLAILKGVFMFFMRQTIIVVSRYIEFDLKNEIYSHYQDLSLAFYRKNNTGDLMNRITEDVSRVRMYIGPAIMYTINLATLFILAISAMISVNPKLTLYSLAPLPLLAITIYFVNNIINKKSELIQGQLSNLSSFVQEVFSGIRVVKAYGREKQTNKDFGAQADIYRDKSMELAQVQAFFFPTMLLLIGLSIILTVYVGGQEVIKGTISAGNIAEFIVYVTMLTWPVTALGWVSSLVQRAAASQKRINEFLNTKSEIVGPDVKAEIFKGNIEFNHVSLTYPDTEITALSELNLKIEAGKVIAIIGKTGSGKSTITNLISRLYDPTEGSVTIDGKKLNEVNLNGLRSQIGYVPQGTFLFSDTIKNNIGFGVSNPSQERIEKAAKDAVVYSNIVGFPKGFETHVGERGVTLSGGQKQRISIARAIIKEPQILIFDDCLSAVDTKTEETILSNLSELMKGKTTIIISHRVSTIKNADKIVVLESGKIVEEGNHDQLLKIDGHYKSLYDKQLLEEQSA
ncbi:MAG: ATP-binding cassette subfamily B multidrug efflux pump [Sphingobacteriales bacterium]|jgi:ATP-binding cassette subfamily B multidrug efflux pump